MTGRIELLTDADCDRLAASAFDILETVGLTVRRDDVLKKMEALGCRVDFSAQVARIPERVVVPIIEGQRAALGAGVCEVREPQSARTYSASFYHNAPFLLDWANGEKRHATRADAVQMIRLAEALPEVPVATCPVMMMGIDPRVEPIHAQALLIRNARQYGSVDISQPEQVEYFAELGRIVANDPGRFMPGVHFTISPMTLDPRTCDLVMEKARYGAHYESGSQATAGGTAPVTAAGTVALAAAEILAGWVAARAMVPEIELYGICCTGVMDMATGGVTFSSPETALQDAAIVELFEKKFGGRTRAVGVSYIGAKVPGIQATMERAFQTMALGAALGRFESVGAGILDNGGVFSPTQAMLDIEFGRMLWHFNRRIRTSHEEIGLDAIREIVSCGKRVFCDSDHTLKHFREALWMPELLSRAPVADAKPDTDRLLAAADHKWREALGSYQPVELDPATDRAISDLLNRAEQDLMRV